MAYDRLDILSERLKGDSDLVQRLRTDPEATLSSTIDQIKTTYPPTAATDQLTFRLAVIVLSIVVIAVVGIIGYTFVLHPEGSIKFPEILIAIGSTSLGALAGLLAPAAAHVQGR